MSSGPVTCAVVGGGISGLAAALTLSRLGRDVVLLEASDRLGGKLHTTRVEGITVETGADSFLERDPMASDLCREVGVEDLREPHSFGAWLWLGDRLRKMPEGLWMGLPVSPRAALAADVLLLRDRGRALADLVIPGPLTGPDVSIGHFVSRRFGRALVDALVDPLLAGTRAGRVDEMSLAAAAPALDRIARGNRSVMRGLASSDEAMPPRFLAPRGGMGTIVAALAAVLERRGVEIRTNAPVRSLTALSRGYRLDAGEEPIDAERVLLAVPAFAAACIAAPLSAAAARELDAIRYASVASVALVYPPDAVELPAEGSGILVSRTAGISTAAVTWFSSKWPHLAPEDGRVVLRAFVGRAGRDPALDLADDDLVARLHEELATMLPLGSAPPLHAVTRWERGLPQYDVGHLDRIERIERALGDHPGIVLTGAGYRGSGVADCVTQAARAAELLHRIPAPRP